MQKLVIASPSHSRVTLLAAERNIMETVSNSNNRNNSNNSNSNSNSKSKNSSWRPYLSPLLRKSIPPAERRAAERVNLLLPKAASLTGTLFFQRPISTTEASSRRRHSYAPQASRDYSRCILDLSVCADDDNEPDDERADNTAAMKELQIHPLRMHPVEKEEEEPPHSSRSSSRRADTNNIAYIAEVLEVAREPGIASVAETASASVTTTTTNDSTDDGTEERGSGDDNNTPPPPHSQEEDTSDDDQGSDTSSVYSADWFPFRELSQISWRTAGSTPADESLPTTTTTAAAAAPKSPYRMGRIRRYGWVEGEPF
ncbi:hypothetical protein GX50_00794 [[Emmonsia] crescens]|uniref:Uncharacterized protein n=1 Tax=[Emmonsia] crescens TaxID=73230 RepID=A0A2B7ZSX4_9EURO|nr:hypothetical protein GX50_00794 [Emmonsia crescens]